MKKKSHFIILLILIAGLLGGLIVGEAQGGSWKWSHPFPTGDQLRDAWMSAGGEVFAVGRYGGIVHFDGSAWSSMYSGTSETLLSVWGASETDVFAVGYNGTIVHYDGTRWEPMTSGTVEYLQGVWGTSGSNVYAVGDNGTILYYDGSGSGWSSVDPGITITNNLYGIWGSSAANIFVVGDLGVIYRYNGSIWEQMNDNTSGTPLFSVWGNSATEVFAVGDGANNVVVQYNGSGLDWTTMPTPSSGTPLRIWGAAGNDIYVVGLSGLLWHYNGSDWTDETGNSNTTEILSGLTGNSGSNVVAVGYNGTVMRFDGSTWNAEKVSLTQVDLYGIWGASENEVFAVGAQETILNYDGAAWTVMETLVDGVVLRAVAGNSGSNVYAVGDSGKIRQYDGNWTDVTDVVTTANLNGVWVAANGEVFIVGDPNPTSGNATIIHFDGVSTWTPMTSGTTNTLNAVWGISESNVFAVGANGTILQYNGTDWLPMNTDTITTTLTCVWGSSATDVITSGQANEIYRYDGNFDGTWTEEVGVVEYPFGLWGSSANDVYAVGGSDANVIERYDGISWSRQLSLPSRPYGIWGSSEGNIFVVGGNGMIFNYTELSIPWIIPANGALGVGTNAAISVVFSQPMNPLTIDSESFQVKDSSGDISGTIVVNVNTVGFTPDAPLPYGSEISIMLTTGIEDTNGNPLENNYAWFFTTVGSGGQGATFTGQSEITTNAQLAFSVYAADIDDDGDLDVLSASDADDTVAWYANTDGNGTFGASQIITNSATGARSVYAADINQDDIADVLSASWGPTNGSNPGMEFAWYENASDSQPAGTFGSQDILGLRNSPISIISADLDNDGDLDAVTASYGDNTVAWFENNDGVGGSWSERTISTDANGAWDVYAADLDNDGDLDVLSASNASNDVAWYENRLNEVSSDFGPQTIISQAADGARVVRAADMDQDGDMDVISASWFDGKIAWYENLDGTFGDPASNQNLIATAEVNTQAMHVVDLDNDGDADVVYGSWRDDIEEIGVHKIVWMENTNGLGTAWASTDISTAVIGCQSLYAADLDADGDLDVLSASQDDNKIAWYENQAGAQPTQYTLTISPVGDGTVTLTPEGGTYNAGTQVELTAVAGEGSRFSAWSGDINSTDNPATITMNSDLNIVATFVQRSTPDLPTAQSPDNEAVIASDPVTLVTSAYDDPDGDDHVASHWEVWRADTGEILVNLRSASDLESHEIQASLQAGLKYYWQVRYEDVDGLTPSQVYAFKIGESELEILPEVAAGQDVGDFGMISIVHWPNDPSPTAVFNIDYDPANYRIGTYNAMTGDYIEFGEGLEMEPGRAYWILAREGLTINFDGVPVSETADVYVALDYNENTSDGWNMVAPPNNFRYYWRNVQVVEDVDGTLTTIGTVQYLQDQETQQGEPNDYIDLRLWRWENGAYASDTPDTDPNAEMQAYAGYWVQAKRANIYLMFEEQARVIASLGMPESMLARSWHKAKAWLRHLPTFSREAIADNDSPPMPPAALGENRVDPVFEGCFIETTESF